MGMIYALVGHKGGVGRTSLALHLGAAAQRAGLRTLLLDASRDGAALAWALAHRERAPTTLRVTPTMAGPDPSSTRRSPVIDLAFGHDITLVDCTAGDEPTMRAVLEVADVALLPCTPSPLDAWAVGETLDFARESAVNNPRLIATVLLNRVDPRTALGRDAGPQLRSQGVPVMHRFMRQRIAYVEALAGDTALHELDPEAFDDVQQLLVALTRMADDAAAQQSMGAPN